MSKTWPLVLGGGALAAYWWSRRSKDGDRDDDASEPSHADEVTEGSSPPTTTDTEAPPGAVAAASSSAAGAWPFHLPLPGAWVWPVPMWKGRRPVISDGFGSRRPNGRRHGGVDLMFERAPADPQRAGTPNGTTHYVMPDNMIALAASDGTIWSAGWTPRGFTIVIDHSPTAPIATYYTHLALLMVAPTAHGKSKQRVHAGQPIGIIGGDPLDAAHLKHLHFEVWRGGPSAAIDPAPLMRAWPRLADPRDPAVAVATRNASALHYRPIGAAGEAYPAWVRELRGKSGVYIIRERNDDGDPVVVYVGQSSAGRLYETLTRHFQDWRRWKRFWKDQYGENHDPGLTYRRDRVEVAVRVTPHARALDEEARLIRRLAPRDNILGQAEEIIPF